MKKKQHDGDILKYFRKTMRIMRLSLFLIIISTAMAFSANSYSQNAKLTMDLNNATVKEVIKAIENQSEFLFFYQKKHVDLNRQVTLHLTDQDVETILDQVFAGTDNIYVINDRQIVIGKAPKKELEKQIPNLKGNIKPVIEQPQQKEITGKVTDTDGLPLPGVSVVVKGTTRGTIADGDGNYTLQNVASDATLVFSFVGMKTQDVPVVGKSQIYITLEKDTENIEEVVVTALGITSSKKSLGYSVSKIAGEDLAEAKETNIANALSGKVAGLLVTPAASGMGGSSRVLIRGNSSLGGNNQPLVVVDGIPIDNSGFGSASGGGTAIATTRTDYGTGISDINPNDIASISILKGPNAAALYGNRAANGAIIVTTKKGGLKKGIGITYSGSMIASSIHEGTLPQFQNKYGQGSGGTFSNDATYNWGSEFDGRTFKYPTGLDGVYSAQPDNITNFFKTGIETTNTVQVESGNESANIRFSYTNFEGKGILPNSDLSKNTFNLRASAVLSDKLSFDSKITYFTQRASDRAVMGWSDHSATTHLYRQVRNAIDEDFKNNHVDEIGRAIHPYNVSIPSLTAYYVQNERTDRDYRDRISGFIKTTYTLNQSLSAFVRVGTDALSHKIQTITPFGSSLYNNGSRSDDFYEKTETNADFLLMFNRKIVDNINLDLNAGGNYRYNKNTTFSKGGQDFMIPTSRLYSNLKTLHAGDVSSRRYSLYSLYFSGSIDYKEKAYLNFTGRNDWDSNMWTASGTSNEWSFFYPSVSLSLLGNELLGISDNGFLSFSKLRMAWSEVGSGGTKNDQVYYYLSNNVGYNKLISITQSNVFDDPLLKPETTRSSELGLELKFFNNRLSADFTYYQSSTFDQIINAPVDASTGFNFKRTNVGEISNKGFELFVGGTPMRTDDFTWDVSANLAKNTSVLESFIEGTNSYLFTGRDNFSVKTKVGGKYGDIWGNDFVYMDGKLVVDKNGLPIASEKEELLGNYLPELTGGLVNTFGYKNLTLSFQIDAQLGGEALSWTHRELGERGSLEATLEGREGMVLDAVDNTGAINTKEITAQQYWGRLGSIPAAFIQDLSNVRLRELTLGYSIPRRWLAKTFIQQASINLIGRNLLFLHKKADGVDPESSVSVSNNGQGVFYYNLPSSRRFGFSLNVSF